MSSKRGLEFLKTISKYCSNDTQCFDSVTKMFIVTEGGNGRCSGELRITDNLLNSSGQLCGGFIATLIDNVTTYALMTKDYHPGVSVNLSVKYFKKDIQVGDQIYIDANIISVENQLANIECVLASSKMLNGINNNNDIIAKGDQTKYILIE